VHPDLTIDPCGRTAFARFGDMPRHWIWTQIAIVVCLIASVVIAITRLA
jgi:hypothetical protein